MLIAIAPGVASSCVDNAYAIQIYLLSNAQQIFTEYEMKLLNIYEYFGGAFI